MWRALALVGFLVAPTESVAVGCNFGTSGLWHEMLTIHEPLFDIVLPAKDIDIGKLNKDIDREPVALELGESLFRHRDFGALLDWYLTTSGHASGILGAPSQHNNVLALRKSISSNSDLNAYISGRGLPRILELEIGPRFQANSNLRNLTFCARNVGAHLSFASFPRDLVGSHGCISAVVCGTGGFLCRDKCLSNPDNTNGANGDTEQRQYSHGPLRVGVARLKLGPPVPFGWAALFLVAFCGGGTWLAYTLIERITRPDLKRGHDHDGRARTPRTDQ